MKILPATLLLSLAATAGCALDEIPGGGSGSNDLQAGVQCTASFKTSGTFAQSQAKPDTVSGCWPVGTWTFTATIDSNECGTPPALLPQYQFKVERLVDGDGDPQETYTYLTDPSSHYRLKVSEGGNGDCEGQLEIFSADGKQWWNLKPELMPDLSVQGFGDYALYDSDQWN